MSDIFYSTILLLYRSHSAHSLFSNQTDRVYAALFDYVVYQNADHDLQISQQKLADILEVSRSPVREALLRLEDEGFLAHSKAGSFVIQHPDARTYRAHLGVMSARLAADKIDQDTLDLLKDNHDKMLKAIQENDLQLLKQLDTAFHVLIAEAADNSFLLSAISRCENVKAFYLDSRLRSINIRAVVKKHAAIIQALDNCDGAAAETAMKEHLQSFL